MSSISQNYSDEKALVDCVQRFFSKHHVGKLLAKCNGMKEKMYSLLMTAFSTTPAVRKQNWNQKFLTIRICISRKVSGCLP